MDDLRARYGQPEKDKRLQTRPSRIAMIFFGVFLLFVFAVFFAEFLAGH